MKHTEKVENQGGIQDMPFFHQKHACNRRNQREIRVVLNSPATSIKHKRVLSQQRYLPCYENELIKTSILNKRRVISLPYKQRALSGSIGEKLKEKMGHKLMIGSHYSYKYGKLPWPLGGHIVPLGGVMGYG